MKTVLIEISHGQVAGITRENCSVDLDAGVYPTDVAGQLLLHCLADSITEQHLVDVVLQRESPESFSHLLQVPAQGCLLVGRE